MAARPLRRRDRDDRRGRRAVFRAAFVTFRARDFVLRLFAAIVSFLLLAQLPIPF
jgi:hypothetical protein